MKVPKTDIGNWAATLADQCFVSQKDRVTDGALWKQYFFTGSSDGKLATLNMSYPHIDRMASSLFSPADTHFSISFDQEKPKTIQLQAKTAGRYLSQEFHRRGVDLEFATGLEWALMKGSAILKLLWQHEGLEPLIVQPELFGVLNESICGLDRQEAFCHRTFLTKGQFENLVKGHPKEAELIANIGRMQSTNTADDMDNDYFHQIVVGGINPIYPVGQSNNTQGQAQVVSSPVPQLSAEVKGGLIVLNELWVQDDDREDYTTIQFVAPNIVIEGELRHRNLCGVQGEHPFKQICPNPIDGYFWGRAELQPLRALQDMLNKRMNEYDRISRLRSNPPRSMYGTTGLTEQDKLASVTPGGWMVPQGPQAKSESLAPELPPELQKQIGEIMSWFDYVGGFENITKGQGEAGVRSGSHADTLVRMASARLRDRSLLIERQCADVADFCFKLLQAKNANQFNAEGSTFLLDQLPDDVRVHVDSHSSSPAFAQEAKQTAAELLKVGAITPKDFIRLTHPPMEDMLVQAAEEREKAAAQEKKEIYEEAKKDPSLMQKLVGSLGKKK